MPPLLPLPPPPPNGFMLKSLIYIYIVLLREVMRRRKSCMKLNMALIKTFLQLFLFRCCLLDGSLCQSPLIPAKYDGFVYEGAVHDHEAKMKSIMVEAFFDPVCPDSRDAWPPLKKALDHYSQVSLTVHPFPLPYHRNAFAACQALHIANKMNPSTAYPLLESFFKYQENYYNAPTYKRSEASIINDMAKLAARTIGEDSLLAFLSAFKDHQMNYAARISFKYGCLRGVTGTPFFFVNGFPLPDWGTPLNYTKWASIFDSLEKQ